MSTCAPGWRSWSARAAGRGPCHSVLAPRRHSTGTCERGVALWRVLIFSIDQDEDLKPRVRTARERTIERMEIMYRPELSTLSERDRKHMLIALEAITDIESWARMRELYGLSFDEACGVWVRAIDRMLPPTPSA